MVSWLIPKFWSFLILTSIVFGGLMASLAGEENFNFLNVLIRFSTIFVLPFIITYTIMYIRNHKLIKKYRSNKRYMRNSEETEKDEELKGIADDIINNNIKVLRKMKLENINNKNK